MNDLGALKDLYNLYSTSADYAALGDMPEVKEANKRFKEWTKYFDTDEILELEEITTGTAFYSEMQGFVYGFRYAMQLIAGCGVKAGASNG